MDSDPALPERSGKEESQLGTSPLTRGPEISPDLQISNPVRRLISAESIRQGSGANPSTADNRLPIMRISYVPTISSPLNPASSASSVSSSDDRATAVEGENLSPTDLSSTSSSGQRQGRRRSSSTISGPQAILRQKSASVLRPPLTPDTPRRLKDLGRDYSRYPSSSDVRSNSPRASVAVAAAPLLRKTTNNPFSDSQYDLEKWGYPDDGIAAFHPYHGGEKGFILYADEIEADDSMHLPRDDDDVVYKAKLSDYFNRKQICSTVGVILLMLGLVCVFILLPILTFTTHLLIPGGTVGHT